MDDIGEHISKITNYAFLNMNISYVLEWEVLTEFRTHQPRPKRSWPRGTTCLRPLPGISLSRHFIYLDMLSLQDGDRSQHPESNTSRAFETI
jgi:hypothetical protein